MILKKEKAQELCESETESEGGYPGLPVPYNYNNNILIILLKVSVDAKQHLKKMINH